jgi:hypothetical protein
MDTSALRNQLNNLLARQASLHSWSRACEWVVVVGVIFEFIVLTVEYREELLKFKLAVVRLPEKPNLWLYIVAFLGVAMVAGGITRQLRIDNCLTTVESQIRQVNDKLLGTVSNEADKLQAQTDDIESRIQSASTKMSGIEKDIAAQGPRAKLLAQAAPTLARELAKFSGQRIELFVCGQQGVAEQETLDAWGVIANILDSDTVAGVTGARWKLVPTNLNFANNCGAARGLGQGIGVMVNKRAPSRVIEAAKALGEGLAKALPPSSNKPLGFIDPDSAKMMVDRGYQAKDAPWTIVAFDPDLITVLIGAHP